MDRHQSGNIIPLLTSRAINSLWHDVLLFPEIADSQVSNEDGGGGGGGGTCTFICTAGSDAGRDASGNGRQSLFSLVTRRRKLLLDGRVVPLEVPPPNAAMAAAAAETASGVSAPPPQSPRTPQTPLTPLTQLTPTGSGRTPSFLFKPNSVAGGSSDPGPCPASASPHYAPLVSWNSGILPQTCLLAPCSVDNSRAASTAVFADGDGSLIGPTTESTKDSSTFSAAPRGATSADPGATSSGGDGESASFFDYAPVEVIEIGSRVREPGDAFAVLPLLAFPVRPHRSTTTTATGDGRGGVALSLEAPSLGDADVSHKLLVIAADDPLIMSELAQFPGSGGCGAGGNIFHYGGSNARPGSPSGGLARRIAEVIQWVHEAGFTAVPGRYENGLFRSASQACSSVRFSPSSPREAQAVILHAHVAWKLLYSTLRRPVKLDHSRTMVRRMAPPPLLPGDAENSAKRHDDSEDDVSTPSPCASTARNDTISSTRSLPGNVQAAPVGQNKQQQQQQHRRMGGSSSKRMYRPSFLDPTAPSSSSPAVAAATAAAAAAATAAVVAVAAAAAAVKASPHEQWAGRIKESLAEHQWHRTAGNGSQRSQHSKHSMSSHRPGSSSGATAFGTALNSGDGGGGGVGGRRPHSAGALSSVTHLLAKPAVSPASVIFTPAFKPPPLGLEGLCEAVHEEQQHLSLAALQQQKLLQRQLQQQYAERQQRAGGRGGDARRGGVQRLLILESDDEMDEDDEFSLDVRTPTLVRGGLGGRGGGGGGGDGGDGAPAGTRELGKKGSGSGYGRSAANEPSPRSTIAPYFKSISIPSIGSPESSDIEYSEGGRQFKGGDFGDRSSDQGSVNSASNSDEDGDNEEDNIEDEDDDDDNDNVDENGDGVSTTVTFSGGHWRMAAATTRLVRSTSLRSCPGDRAKRSESWGIHWKLGLGIRVSSNDDLKGAGAGAGAGTGAPAAVGSKPAMLKWLREGPKPDAAAASEQEEGGGLGLLLGRAHSTGKEAAAELVAAAIRVLRKAGSEGSGGGRGTAGRPPPSPTTPSGSKEGWDAGSAAGSGAGSATTSPASAAGDGSRASGNGSDGGKRSFSGPLGISLGGASSRGILKGLKNDRGNGKEVVVRKSKKGEGGKGDVQEQESDVDYSPDSLASRQLTFPEGMSSASENPGAGKGGLGGGLGGENRLRRMAALPLLPGARPLAHDEATMRRLTGWKGSKSANCSLKAGRKEGDGESSRATGLTRTQVGFSPAELGSATPIVLPWEVMDSTKGGALSKGSLTSDRHLMKSPSYGGDNAGAGESQQVGQAGRVERYRDEDVGGFIGECRNKQS